MRECEAAKDRGNLGCRPPKDEDAYNVKGTVYNNWKKSFALVRSGHQTRKRYGYFRCPGNKINAVQMWFIFCVMIWCLFIDVPK